MGMIKYLHKKYKYSPIEDWKLTKTKYDVMVNHGEQIGILAAAEGGNLEAFKHLEDIINTKHKKYSIMKITNNLGETVYDLAMNKNRSIGYIYDDIPDDYYDPLIEYLGRKMIDSLFVLVKKNKNDSSENDTNTKSSNDIVKFNNDMCVICSGKIEKDECYIICENNHGFHKDCYSEHLVYHGIPLKNNSYECIYCFGDIKKECFILS